LALGQEGVGKSGALVAYVHGGSVDVQCHRRGTVTVGVGDQAGEDALHATGVGLHDLVPVHPYLDRLARGSRGPARQFAQPHLLTPGLFDARHVQPCHLQ
jgi:hypothetical protein